MVAAAMIFFILGLSEANGKDGVLPCIESGPGGKSRALKDQEASALSRMASPYRHIGWRSDCAKSASHT